MKARPVAGARTSLVPPTPSPAYDDRGAAVPPIMSHHEDRCGCTIFRWTAASVPSCRSRPRLTRSPPGPGCRTGPPPAKHGPRRGSRAPADRYSAPRSAALRGQEGLGRRRQRAQSRPGRRFCLLPRRDKRGTCAAIPTRKSFGHRRATKRNAPGYACPPPPGRRQCALYLPRG